MLQLELVPLLEDIVNDAVTYSTAATQMEDIRQRMRDLLPDLEAAGEAELAAEFDDLVTHMGQMVVALESSDDAGVADAADAQTQDIDDLVDAGLTC